ncbi:FeoB-associated Cys-rich membrane protein [Desulfosarcina sp. OttesenSCG-928-A07]|nr:FeoB-associated Cys-rich membrane protein [Desulfosarcina sp. OttesenSCG-928-G17]MDL2328646.1 FeoB-associated Cys-rich membrane protein [Desulfosarcina sp. OttesenSCG-928-A07]
MAETLIIGLVFLGAVVYLGRRIFKTTRGGGCGCSCGCSCGDGQCPPAGNPSPPSDETGSHGKSG